MSDLLAGIMIWAASTGAMLKIFKIAKMEFHDAHEALTFSSGFGLAILAYLVFLLGSAHLLHSGPVAAFLLVMMALFVKTTVVEAVPLFKKGCYAPAFPEVLYFSALVLAAGFSLAGALAPATGQDELCYHLAQPKNYLRGHAIFEVPYSSSALWPYLMEMLFTLGLLLKGAGLAKFFHWAMAMTAVSAVHCFTRRFIGERAALFAMLGFALTPAVFIQASFAYVDNALACYAFLAFYATYVYWKGGRLSWAVLAGVSTGFAISVKFIGLFMVLTLAPVFLLAAFQRRGNAKTAFTAPGLFAATVFLAGGLWYVRAWILRGNPFFPFYPQFFGGHGWPIDTYVDAHGRGKDVLSFLRLLWDTALHPQWFGGEHIGPFYLIFLPMVIFLRPFPGAVRFSLVIGAVYTLLWFKVDPNIRFFFPALAIFSVPAGAAMAWLSETPSKTAKVLTHGCFVLMFGVLAAFAAYHFGEEASLLWHRGDEGGYISRHDRSYAASRQINRELGAGDKIISVGEVRGYYFDAPFVIEGELNRFTGYGRKLTSVAEVSGFLKEKGFTHALYYDNVSQGPPPGGPVRLASFLKPGDYPRDHFKEVMSIRSKDGHYILYEIV